MTISGANIGIGTTDPSAAKLVVVGDIRTGTSGTNGCVQNFAGTAIAGTCSSDQRLKTVTGNVGSVLDRLTQLDLVTYHWNQTAADLYHNNQDATNTGYLAQQVQAQFPELVSTDSNGYEQLNYTTLSLYGLEAIKELYAKIQPLQAVLTVEPTVDPQCVTGDIGTDGTNVTVSSCGTSPAVTVGSTDTAGEIAEGTIATGCTIAFTATKTYAPFCTVTSQAGLVFSYAVSTTAITVTNVGALSSTKLNYTCVQNNH